MIIFELNQINPNKISYHSMKTISISEARNNLHALVESVRASDQQVVMTKNGRPIAVLVSPDEFKSWRETMKVRLDAELMTEIKNGMKALKKGGATLYTLEELLPE